jgi:hypothetical protein
VLSAQEFCNASALIAGVERTQTEGKMIEATGGSLGVSQAEMMSGRKSGGRKRFESGIND